MFVRVIAFPSGIAHCLVLVLTPEATCDYIDYDFSSMEWQILETINFRPWLVAWKILRCSIHAPNTKTFPKTAKQSTS